LPTDRESIVRVQLEYAPVPNSSAIADAATYGLPDKDAPILAAARVSEVRGGLDHNSDHPGEGPHSGPYKSPHR